MQIDVAKARELVERLKAETVISHETMPAIRVHFAGKDFDTGEVDVVTSMPAHPLGIEAAALITALLDEREEWVEIERLNLGPQR